MNRTLAALALATLALTGCNDAPAEPTPEPSPTNPPTMQPEDARAAYTDLFLGFGEATAANADEIAKITLPTTEVFNAAYGWDADGSKFEFTDVTPTSMCLTSTDGVNMAVAIDMSPGDTNGLTTILMTPGEECAAGRGDADVAIEVAPGEDPVFVKGEDLIAGAIDPGTDGKKGKD